MESVTLNNGVKMPMAGIGTFLLTSDEAEASVLSALENGERLRQRKGGGPRDKEVRLAPRGNLPRNQAVARVL